MSKNTSNIETANTTFANNVEIIKEPIMKKKRKSRRYTPQGKELRMLVSSLRDDVGTAISNFWSNRCLDCNGRRDDDLYWSRIESRHSEDIILKEIPSEYWDDYIQLIETHDHLTLILKGIRKRKIDPEYTVAVLNREHKTLKKLQLMHFFYMFDFCLKKATFINDIFHNPDKIHFYEDQC